VNNQALNGGAESYRRLGAVSGLFFLRGPPPPLPAEHGQELAHCHVAAFIDKRYIGMDPVAVLAADFYFSNVAFLLQVLDDFVGSTFGYAHHVAYFPGGALGLLGNGSQDEPVIGEKSPVCHF